MNSSSRICWLTRNQTRPADLTNTECGEVFRNTLMDLRITIEQTNAIIRVIPSQLWWRTLANRPTLQNLLSNALKYSGRSNHACTCQPSRVAAIGFSRCRIMELESVRILRTGVCDFQRLHGKDEYPAPDRADDL